MVPGPVGSDQANARFAVCSLCIATFPRASANTSTCYTRLMPGLSGLRLTFPRTNGRLPWLLWTIFRWYETNKWPSENRRAAWQGPLPSGAEKEGEGEREREFSGNENSRILNPSQSNHVSAMRLQLVAVYLNGAFVVPNVHPVFLGLPEMLFARIESFDETWQLVEIFERSRKHFIYTSWNFINAKSVHKQKLTGINRYIFQKLKKCLNSRLNYINNHMMSIFI